MLLDEAHPYDCARQHQGEVDIKCLNNQTEVDLIAFQVTMKVTKDNIDEFFHQAQTQGDLGPAEIPFYEICLQSGFCPRCLFDPDILSVPKYYRFCRASLDQFKPWELDEMPNLYIESMGYFDSEVNHWSELKAKEEAKSKAAQYKHQRAS